MIVPLARKSVIAGIIQNEPLASHPSSRAALLLGEGPRSVVINGSRLASSPEFWTLIEERRGHKTISRAELEQRLDQAP
jgi:hypothetical protein